MQHIRPETFAALMRLPVWQRADLLEFIGSTPVADRDLRALITRLASGELPEAPQAA